MTLLAPTARRLYPQLVRQAVLTFPVRHHRVARLAGLAAAHAVHGEHAEAVGGERPQTGHVERGHLRGDVQLPALVPRALRVEHPAAEAGRQGREAARWRLLEEGLKAGDGWTRNGGESWKSTAAVGSNWGMVAVLMKKTGLLHFRKSITL